jgi:hypothetical protein
MQPVRSVLSALMIPLIAACSWPHTAQASAVDRAGSLAQITVFDRTDGKPLPLYWHEGELWVPGVPGHEFEVKVRNAQGRDMLAVVSVDGVNVVSGEAAAPEQTGYVLSGWREYSIQGWRKSLERTAAFYFTPMKDSYAARTGRAGDVGVIGVAVFLRKLPPPPVTTAPPIPLRGMPQEDGPRMKDSADSAGSNAARDTLASTRPAASAPPPAAESAAKSASATLGEQRAVSARQESAKLGTGHGRSEYSVVRNVPFERATVTPQETIVIRYDSRANLERRGIIATRAPERTPRAFPAARDPAFVPDPPGF